MFKVNELQQLAKTLKPAIFLKQLGPFVLIQRPPDTEGIAKETEAMGLPMNMASTSMARPGAVDSGTLALLFQFESLVVATLPPLQGEDELSVGRAPDCDLMIEHASVSKRHATLRWDDAKKRATVQDLGSTNGTFLNAAIKIRTESILKDGDIISFGDVQFWYLLTGTLYAKLLQTPSAMRGV